MKCVSLESDIYPPLSPLRPRAAIRDPCRANKQPQLSIPRILSYPQDSSFFPFPHIYQFPYYPLRFLSSPRRPQRPSRPLMEEADEPPLPFSDRIRSFAKSSASDQTPHDKGYPPPPALVGRSSDHNASNPPPPRPFSNRGAIPDSYVKGKHKSGNGVVNSTSSALPPPAPPPPDTQDASEKHTPIASGEGKPGWPVRIKAGSKRFVKHTKDAIFHSWINVLLVFVPIGIAMNFAPLPESSKPTVVFAFNAIAIIPLAGLLSHATEVVASSMGDTWASLLNVTFGNAVELIIL